MSANPGGGDYVTIPPIPRPCVGCGVSEAESHIDDCPEVRKAVERAGLRLEDVRQSPSEATMSNEHATIEALRAEVELAWESSREWKARALAAEADAATLSEKLAARATVRHNLDPTQP